jgi:hypothetical protein
VKERMALVGWNGWGKGERKDIYTEMAGVWEGKDNLCCV